MTNFNKSISVILFHGYNVGISLLNNILLNRPWWICFSSSNSDPVAEFEKKKKKNTSTGKHKVWAE